VGSKTYYAVKWFVRRPVFEDVVVPITDERHQQHDYVMRLLQQAGEQNSTVSFESWRVQPGRVRVDTGETALTGAVQGSFHAYPEVGVRTKDPKLTGGRTPATCMAGWHVPFLTTLSQFAPANHRRYGQQQGTTEAWLVKVGGAHSNIDRENKVAFTHIELRKQLDIGDILRLQRLVAACETAQVFTKPEAVQRYSWSTVKKRPNDSYMQLLSFLKGVDLRPNPRGYGGTLLGTGQYVLLNADSVRSAEAE